MANPCKYTLKDGTVLDFTQARQYVMDNIAELTKESPTLKAKYDAATKGKVEGDNKQEYKEGDKGGERPKAGSRNRAKSSKAIPEEVRTPDVTAVFNMLGDILPQFMEEVKETVAPIVQEEAKPMTERERADAIADRLDSLADEIGNQTNSSIPFLPQAVKAALKAAANLMRSNAGATLVELVDAAIKALRSHTDYAGLTDSQKKDIEDDLADKVAKNSVEFIESQKGSGKFKVSKTAEDFIAGLRKDGKDDLADIVEAGKYYEVRNQKKVLVDAQRLHDADADIAYELARKGELHPDIINSIFAQRLIDAQAAFANDQNANTTEAFEQANKDYQTYGTYIAQGMSMRGFLANLIPSMMVDRIRRKLTNDVKNSFDVKDNQKIANIATEAKQIRRNVFESIAAVVSGQNVNVKELSNPKIKKALDVLVSFGANLNKNGATGTGLAQLLELVDNEGKLAVDATRAQVREMVNTNLRSINEGLKANKMSEAQVEKATNAFMEVYEDIASARMQKAIENAYKEGKGASITKSRNPAIARLILYGGLEGEAYRNKFAAKYNLPTLTDEDVATLTQLAQNVAASMSRGAFAMNNANNALNNYMNSLKAKSLSTIKNPLKKYAKILNYVAAYQFNNLLLKLSILNKATLSNLLQALPKTIRQMVRERDITLGGNVFNTVETTSEDPVSKNQIKVKLSPTRDNMIFGSEGMNREGLSDLEADILKMKGKMFGIIPNKTASKVFLVGSSRFFAVTDALTIPLATAVASRQAYAALLKSLYKEQGNPKSRSAIYADVNALLGRDVTTVSAAFAKAMDEIRKGQTWRDLGFKPTDAFPQDPRIKGLATKEARIYNEAKIRMYEILADGVTERLIQLNLNIDPALTTDNALLLTNEQQKEINRFISATTREISFLGRPQGSPGQFADIVVKVGRSFPALKHSTLLPLFPYAVGNGMSLLIKFNAILSAPRYAAYKILGRRGTMFLPGLENEKKQAYKQDFMRNMDQDRLGEAMLAGFAITAGTIAMLVKLRGDDDDDDKRRAKAIDGEFTGIFTKEMEGRGLKGADGKDLQGGYIYVDGVKQYNWMVTPYYGAFAAAAVLDNYTIFQTLPGIATGGRKPFIEEDEEVMSAIGMLLMNTMSGVMNYSSMTQQYKMLSDFMALTSETTKNVAERSGEAFVNSFANMIQSFVPLSGLQKDVQNAYDAYNGNPSKLALDFGQKVAINLAFVDGVLRSNKTDCFGRPVEEELKVVGPWLGFDLFQFDNGKVSLPFNRAYDKDPYMKMHTMHNYFPVIQSSTTIPDVVGIEEGEDDAELKESLKRSAMRRGRPVRYDSAVDRGNLESFISELKASERVKEGSIKKEALNPEYPEYVTYNLELTTEENQAANELMGKLVKEVFDYVVDYDDDTKQDITNMSKMLNFNNNEQYKQSMTSLYSICKKIAMIRQIPDVQSQKLYLRSTRNAIRNWDQDNLLLKFPQNLKDELSGYKENIDLYGYYLEDSGKKSYENWLKAGKPEKD